MLEAQVLDKLEVVGKDKSEVEKMGLICRR